QAATTPPPRVYHEQSRLETIARRLAVVFRRGQLSDLAQLGIHAAGPAWAKTLWHLGHAAARRGRSVGLADHGIRRSVDAAARPARHRPPHSQQAYPAVPRRGGARYLAAQAAE